MGEPTAERPYIPNPEYGVPKDRKESGSEVVIAEETVDQIEDAGPRLPTSP
jgi:hypothetical protein